MASVREKDLAKEIADKALAEGLRVWLSDDGEGGHGFFSNQEGTRVVSFQNYFGMPRFTGNYGPPTRSAGTGWCIQDDIGSSESLSPLLNAYPPSYCVGWSYFTTVDQHLKVYGKCCRYKEVTK